jgi:excisionase family DNA binding protein
MSPAIQKNFFTIGQAAAYLGLSKRTIRRWIFQKKLISTQDENGTHIIGREVLEAVSKVEKPVIQKSNSTSESPLLSIASAADLLGVSKRTLMRWKRLRSYKRTIAGSHAEGTLGLKGTD